MTDTIKTAPTPDYNDDYDARLSAVAVDLAAGDEVFVFVDSLVRALGARRYTLEAYVGELPPR